MVWFNFLALVPSENLLPKFTNPPAIPPIKAPQGPKETPPIAPCADAIKLSDRFPHTVLFDPGVVFNLLIKSILLDW